MEVQALNPRSLVPCPPKSLARDMMSAADNGLALGAYGVLGGVGARAALAGVFALSIGRGPPSGPIAEAKWIRGPYKEKCSGDSGVSFSKHKRPRGSGAGAARMSQEGFAKASRPLPRGPLGELC